MSCGPKHQGDQMLGRSTQGVTSQHHYRFGLAMPALPTEIMLHIIKAYIDDLLEQAAILMPWECAEHVMSKFGLDSAAVYIRTPLVREPIRHVVIALPELLEDVYRIVFRARAYHYAQYESHTKLLHKKYGGNQLNWKDAEDKIANETLWTRRSVSDRVCVTVRAWIDEKEWTEKTKKKKARELELLKAMELEKTEVSKATELKKAIPNQ